MEDKIRVVRLIVYEGPRSVVEEQVANSIHGILRINGRVHIKKGMTIQGITLGTYPDILEAEKQGDIDG